MQLTVVGCSGSTSGPASPASSYLVQAPHQGRTFSLLLDLGPGSFGALYNYLDPSEVDAIGLSHLHPDHCLDLCAYYVWARYSHPDPLPACPVYGPNGTASRMVAAYDVPAITEGPAEPTPGIGGYVPFRTWQPRQQIGPFEVRVARVDHPVEAYAVRVEEHDQDGPPGPTLVFSGDTGPCEALVELARGVDLLLVEAAFREHPDNPPGVHLTARQAVEAGETASAKRVVLTHIPPWHDPAAVLDEAQAVAHSPVELARTGAQWTLP